MMRGMRDFLLIGGSGVVIFCILGEGGVEKFRFIHRFINRESLVLFNVFDTDQLLPEPPVCQNEPHR